MESTDRTERKSCGDPDELAAQEEWIKKMEARRNDHGYSR